MQDKNSKIQLPVQYHNFYNMYFQLKKQKHHKTKKQNNTAKQNSVAKQTNKQKNKICQKQSQTNK